MQPLYLRISLDQLRCLRKADAWRDSEPYMWNVFFKIDGEGVRLSDRFRLEGRPLYHLSPGSHGNLRAGVMTSGDTVGIPNNVGEWKVSLVPLRIPYFETSISGLVGVVCVLMEQNYVSRKGAEAGHKALNDYIIGAIDASIDGFDPRRVDIHQIDASIKNYFDAQVREFTSRIGNLVGEAVASSQSIVQNIFSLVRRDALVGYKVWDFSNAGIEAEGGQLRFKHHIDTKKYGEWEIRGSLTARRDEPALNAILSGEEE